MVPETLAPVEQAVFVLCQASAFSRAEIGEFFGRPEATVQQIVHRVRKRVDER
ncbi:sigma factor-like helix-turn-helix DNA-binding protein [Streptomyces sp. NPDC087859]|uniref:sigma-70 region 4 domain-containing protein n=1 Tax=Streptomyces sp. NPDC087859 TaxID=3365812 RepID=UPI00381C24B7